MMNMRQMILTTAVVCIFCTVCANIVHAQIDDEGGDTPGTDEVDMGGDVGEDEDIESVGDQYAVCDACGFCIHPDAFDAIMSKTPDPPWPIDPEPAFQTPDGEPIPVPTLAVPGAWAECARCLYGLDEETINEDALDGNTLKIDPETNTPMNPPRRGRIYTMMGCINSRLDTFSQDEGGAVGVVDFLLNGVMVPITGAISFIYIIYGAFIVLSSRGQTGRLNYGKRILTGAIIGLLFVLLSIYFVRFIGQTLEIPGF